MSVVDDMGGEIMLVLSQRVIVFVFYICIYICICISIFMSVFLDMDDDTLLAFIHSVDHKQGASVSGDHELTT